MPHACHQQCQISHEKQSILADCERLSVPAVVTAAHIQMHLHRHLNASVAPPMLLPPPPPLLPPLLVPPPPPLPLPLLLTPLLLRCRCQRSAHTLRTSSRSLP
jgi:hypothetical protein